MIIGIISALCLVGSFWAAWQAWWGTHPVIFWIYATALLIFIPTTIIGAFYILPNTPVGRILFVDPPTEEEVIPFISETQRLRQLVGEVGKSLTLHNSGGMITVGDKRYHSESEGVLIEPQSPVRVIGVKGNNLLVREITQQEFDAIRAEQAAAKQASVPPTEPKQPMANSQTPAIPPMNGSSTLADAGSKRESQETASNEPNVDFDIP
ncbi:MAG: hypothetical protein CMJ46_14140 [Planctomyces sp.]|nr:hypothetical protein [Planctomyces sp.]